MHFQIIRHRKKSLQQALCCHSLAQDTAAVFFPVENTDLLWYDSIAMKFSTLFKSIQIELDNDEYVFGQFCHYLIGSRDGGRTRILLLETIEVWGFFLTLWHSMEELCTSLALKPQNNWDLT